MTATAIVKFHDDGKITVEYDNILGVNARKIDVVYKLLYQELAHLRAVERHKASGATITDVPVQETDSSPSDIPTSVESSAEKIQKPRFLDRIKTALTE